MSKARAKGTRGENYFLGSLRVLFGPQVERAPLKGTADYGDYVGVPWLHEAKHTAKPLFQQWARKCRAKAGGAWVLLWKGDLRTEDGQPLVLMPFDQYVSLVNGQHLPIGERVRAAHAQHVNGLEIYETLGTELPK